MPRGHPTPGLPAELVLRSATPWTAVLFAGLLGGLHLTVAGVALWHGRWEAYFGLGLGTMFALATAALARLRTEVQIVPVERRVFVRTGVRLTDARRIGVEHSLRFDEVRGVRLTLLPGSDAEARIEILALDGDIECPPTAIPRQEALLLAMMIGVPLFKVTGDEDGSAGPPADAQGPGTGRPSRLPE